jgi:hypothetical protein
MMWLEVCNDIWFIHATTLRAGCREPKHAMDGGDEQDALSLPDFVISSWKGQQAFDQSTGIHAANLTDFVIPS